MSILLLVLLFLRSFVCSFVCLFICLFVYSFACSFVCLFGCLLVCLFACLLSLLLFLLKWLVNPYIWSIRRLGSATRGCWRNRLFLLKPNHQKVVWLLAYLVNWSYLPVFVNVVVAVVVVFAVAVVVRLFDWLIVVCLSLFVCCCCPYLFCLFVVTVVVSFHATSWQRAGARTLHNWQNPWLFDSPVTCAPLFSSPLLCSVVSQGTWRAQVSKCRRRVLLEGVADPALEYRD